MGHTGLERVIYTFSRRPQSRSAYHNLDLLNERLSQSLSTVIAYLRR